MIPPNEAYRDHHSQHRKENTANYCRNRRQISNESSCNRQRKLPNLSPLLYDFATHAAHYQGREFMFQPHTAVNQCQYLVANQISAAGFPASFELDSFSRWDSSCSPPSEELTEGAEGDVDSVEAKGGVKKRAIFCSMRCLIVTQAIPATPCLKRPRVRISNANVCASL